MGYSAQRIPYRETGSFSPLVVNYLDNHPSLQPFVSQEVSLRGIKNCIEERRQRSVDRILLADRLTSQYQGMDLPDRLQKNLELIRQDNCFTVTTAHQNNLFSGPLYFIYKILHAIALAESLKKMMPDHDFVPVFYMGAEDADLAELDHIHIGTEKIQWNTNQTGAVGRMVVDQGLVALIDRIEGQLGVYPHGGDWIRLLRECYVEGRTIAEATFRLVHDLFSSQGLLVLLPDHADLKRLFIPVIKKELLEQFTAPLVQGQTDALAAAGYKVQASPRTINLFYLQQGSRQRIEKEGEQWIVQGTSKVFDRGSLLQEVEQHPERFSPNVLLRGLFQCTLLPDVAFIGGGAEIAYWLQVKKLFAAAAIPLPVLVLRNSFLLLEPTAARRLANIGLEPGQLFATTDQQLRSIVQEATLSTCDLSQERNAIHQLYSRIKQQAGQLDPTLESHVSSLEKRSLHGLEGLEKKLWRVIKRKHQEQQHQLQMLHAQLFPQGKLQERHENIGIYYAQWGREFLEELLSHSQGLTQEFTILRLP